MHPASLFFGLLDRVAASKRSKRNFCCCAHPHRAAATLRCSMMRSSILELFDGRIIHSAEIERIHREVLDFKHIEAISEPMRELIEDLWPELVNKLAPKAN